MIKTIIFDIGKVLVGYDWDSFLMNIFQDREKVDGILDALFAHGVWDEVDRGVWSSEELQQGFIKEAPDLEEELRYTWSVFGNAIYKYDFTDKWIKELQDRNYQVLYLSNWSYHLLNNWPTQLDFTKRMDGGIFSCHVKMIKPDKKIYETLLEKYNLIPEECVFLDDREDNIESAKSCGINGIVVKNHQQAVEDLERLLNER